MKASAIFLSKILSAFPRNFGGSFNTSYHANLKPGSASSPGVWHQIPRPLTVTSVLKTKFFIPISADEKSYFRFEGSGQSFGLFLLPSPCQAIHSDYYMSLYPLLCPSGHRMQHPLAFFLTWICYFGREELTYIPYSSFNGQSLAVC